MGRRKKHITKDQQIRAKRERQKRYYESNKEIIIGKNMDRYYKKLEEDGEKERRIGRLRRDGLGD
jgi:hypothetical protein